MLVAAVALTTLIVGASAFQTQPSQPGAPLLSRSGVNSLLAPTTICRTSTTALNTIRESRSGDDGFIRSSSINNKSNSTSSQRAPLYITIGPPCAGKTQALISCLERDGYNPEQVLSSKEVALDDQSDVYVRVPLAAFIFPRTRLDPKLGATILRSGTTLKDRLLDPPTSNLADTDTELRNVVLRVAGRTTPQEFANRTRSQALLAGDTVQFFRRRRIDVAEDLIEGVEQVSARAVGELLFTMLQEKEQQNVADLEEHNDLPYDSHHDEDDEKDDDDKAKEPPIDLTAANATSAHLLSAKALIKTPYVNLFVPQALFNGGIDKAEKKLQKLLSSSAMSVPVSWGNTNTRPVEYAAALRAAQRAGRPVKFVAWGTPNLPRVPRSELLRRTVSKFRNTGRYVPAGAVAAALGRVERLIQEAEKEAQKLAVENYGTNATATAMVADDTKLEITIDVEEGVTAAATSSSRDSEIELTELELQENQRMDIALAALGGFAMNGDGNVMKITEAKNLHQKSYPWSNKEPSESVNTSKAVKK